MPRHPRPDGFGNRGARDDRVGEILPDSDEEIITRDLSPSLEYDPAKDYTVPDPPPPSPDNIWKKERAAEKAKEKTQAKAAEQNAMVAAWAAEVEQAVGSMPIDRTETVRKRDRLRLKARAVMAVIFRKK